MTVVLGPGDESAPGMVVVTLPEDQTEAIAAAAVHAWMGVRAFRTVHPDHVRLAVDMTESLAGRRPPALTRRGLA